MIAGCESICRVCGRISVAMAGPAGDLYRFTVDEYERMADVGILPDWRLELIDGLVAAMSPRGERHGMPWHC